MMTILVAGICSSWNRCDYASVSGWVTSIIRNVDYKVERNNEITIQLNIAAGNRYQFTCRKMLKTREIIDSKKCRWHVATNWRARLLCASSFVSFIASANGFAGDSRTKLIRIEFGFRFCVSIKHKNVVQMVFVITIWKHENSRPTAVRSIETIVKFHDPEKQCRRPLQKWSSQFQCWLFLFVFFSLSFLIVKTARVYGR